MSAATVPVADLRRRLGAADVGDGAMLREFAACLGVELEVTKDWSGRPAVTEAGATELVAAVEAHNRERRQVKRRQQRDLEAARDALDVGVAEAAGAAYRKIFDAEMWAGRYATAELAAWTAAVQAGLDAQEAATAPADAQPAPQARPRRWWQR